ncbi:MAG: hypothetical protein AABW86_00900 [Candidatus Micrarchaeota archaeon]
MAEEYGEYAFLAGLVIAVLVGVFATFVQPWLGLLMALLALLGLIVGLLNITDKEINSFLLAALVLIASAAALGNAFTLFGAAVQGAISGFAGALTAFVAPAAVIVAIKSVYSLASKK